MLSTFCILKFFMKLMFKILDIFMFVANMYYVVFIRLNNTVTLGSNQGGAVKVEMNLHIKENRN